MKLKKVLLGVTAMLVYSTAFAQIPVTVTTDVPAAANQIQTMAKWAAQYQQMLHQIEQAQRQYESLTGSRGLGTIMNNPQLRDYLPTDWQGVYDAVKTGGYAGLSGRGQSVYDANKIFDSCQSVTAGEQRTACEARAVKASQDKGFALDAYDKARSRINQIDQLMNQINHTSDPKSIAELQARIATEQANIQNEQTKLQLYGMIAAAEDKVQAQRHQEIQAKTWSARNPVPLEPLSFGQ